MRAPHDLSWAALLLSCAATSAVTALAASLVLHHSQQQLGQKPRSESTAIRKSRKSQLATPATSTQSPSSTLKTPLHHGAPKPAIHLRDLAPDAVPPELRVDAYFAPHHIQAFAYRAVFDGCANVFAVLDAIHPYLERFFRERLWLSSPDAPSESNVTILKASGKRDHDGHYEDETRRSPWRLPEFIDATQATDIVLYPGVDSLTFVPDKILNLDPTDSTKQIIVASGARVLGGVLDVSAGSIYIGRGVCIEPYVMIKGPCIIGDYSTVRSGAYLRGDLIIGSHVVLRGELKNALVMDRAELCHPGYCGDSICGYKSHFGNQVTTANLNLMAKDEIRLQAGDRPQWFNIGRKKMGVVLGDFAQLGCSSVTDPCTLLRPHTIVYPLTRLRKGIYGPHVIVKNKPLEKGVLEVAPLVPPPAETET